MSSTLVLFLLVLGNVCIAANNQKGDVKQCIDNDALRRETFAAIESAIKVSQYGRQSEKLKALERLEKHVTNIRPIIMTEVPHPTAFADCVDVKNSGLENNAYTISPSGSDPIKVYCDSVTDGGGWIVFQRRNIGVENFDRTFDDYARGFGDVSHGDFWLGNNALKTLTATGDMDLRIDMWDWNGEYRYAKYSNFRITGDNFVLSFDDNSYVGNAGDSLAYHNGKGFTTRDHDVDLSPDANCAEVLQGGWWFNFCHHTNLNGRYINNSSRVEKYQGIQWSTWKGFRYSLWKTEMKLRPSSHLGGPEDYPRDCAAALAVDSYLDSGVYTIAPPGRDPLDVYCDMDTDGGGWTVFQKRHDGRISFEASFYEFARGFGETSGDYWLGNYALRNMTNPQIGRFELRVDMWDWAENHRYAVYQDFSITGRDFTLNIGEYSGDAGDSLSYHNGMGFTAGNHDVDRASGGNCAKWLYGGWWYKNCHRANLNGHYKNELDATTEMGGQQDQGLQWVAWKGNQYSLKRTEMKFRPVQTSLP